MAMKTTGEKFVWRRVICAYCGKQIRKDADVSGEQAYDYETWDICRRCRKRNKWGQDK